MATLADYIERYIRHRLHQRGSGVLEIQRNELAERFDCAPSQINYVLNTRFSVERGFAIESRRGGGGYVRIMRLRFQPGDQALNLVTEHIGDAISFAQAEEFVGQLRRDGVLTAREAAMMHQALHPEQLGGDDDAASVRADVFKSMLLAVLKPRRQ